MIPAAEKFLEAYQMSGRPTLLKNAARAYERAQKTDEAIRAWTQYRDHPEVDAAIKAQTAERIDALRGQGVLRPLTEMRTERAPAPRPLEIEPVPEVAAVRVAEAPGPPIAGYALVGGGSLAVIGGGVLFISGWATYWGADDEFANLRVEQTSAAEVRSGLGLALIGLGAAVVTSAVLFAFDD